MRIINYVLNFGDAIEQHLTLVKKIAKDCKKVADTYKRLNEKKYGRKNCQIKL